MKKKFYILLWVVAVYLSMGVSTNFLAYVFLTESERAIVSNPVVFGVYNPIDLIMWLINFNINLDRLLISIAAGFIFLVFCSAFLIIAYAKTNRSKSGSYGTSRWANNKDVKNFLSNPVTGVVLGQTREAKYKNDLSNDSWSLKKIGKILSFKGNEHCLIVAPTRRGKGINNVIPTLLSWKESVAVYDIKKENFEKTAGFRSKFSHVLMFEPTNPKSVKFNPLMEIEKGDEEVSQVQNLVEILTDPDGGAKPGDHWRNTAKQLLVGVIIHILYAEENKTLPGVYKFINDPGRTIYETLNLMLDTPHKHGSVHETVAESARNMLNKEEKELSSVVSTASSYLTLYQDPVVGNNLASSDFAIKDLMFIDKPCSLYIIINPGDADRLKPLVRLMFQLIGTKLTKRLGGYKNKMLFLIDEFPSLGKMEFIETQLAFFAGYGIKCMLITQSFSQLFKHYSQDTSIPDNCRIKVVLGADTPKEAELVGKYLGNETIERESVSKSGRNSDLLASNTSRSFSEMGRSLLTTDEVLRLPYDEILLLSGGMYPYKAKKIFYYLDSRFNKFTDWNLDYKCNLSKPVTPWYGVMNSSYKNEYNKNVPEKEEEGIEVANLVGVEEDSINEVVEEGVFSTKRRSYKKAVI